MAVHLLAGFIGTSAYVTKQEVESKGSYRWSFEAPFPELFSHFRVQN